MKVLLRQYADAGNATIARSPDGDFCLLRDGQVLCRAKTLVALLLMVGAWKLDSSPSAWVIPSRHTPRDRTVDGAGLA